MARISFTFKNNVGTNASTTGSFLQAGSANLGTDDSSALRADGYTIPPSDPASSSSFSAIATDYDTVQLSWAITTTLVDPSSLVGDTPQAVSLALSYSPFGPPQTLLNGQTLETITANNSISTLPHHGLTGGAWAYYSLFVKYSSATGRSWYERLGSTEELVPFNYGSTDMLYRRIPLHYRLQDEQIGITNPFGSFPERTDIAMAGPLYRMLDVFGWDIDTLRTTVDYVMQQKDPRVANSDMLKNLSLEVGLPLDIESLGAANLRNVLTDYGYLTQNEGLPTGVQEYVTAVSGCNTNITFNRSNLFSATQKAMSSVAVTTNGSSAPATNQWLLQYGTTGTPTFTCASVSSFTGKNIVTPTTALNINLSALVTPSVQVACLKTKIQNVSQASSMYLDFGATYSSLNDAHVLGWALSPTVQAASVVTPTISTRVNLCFNPSIESVVTGWATLSNTAVARVAGTWGSGAQVLQVTCNNASATGVFIGSNGFVNYPVTGGLTYTVSLYGKHISGTPRVANVIFNWTRPSGNTFGGSGASITLSETPQRMSATGVAPADATHLTIWVQCYSSGTTTAADISQWDMCLLEQSSEVGRYFDNYDIIGSSSTLESYVPAFTDGITSVYEQPVYLGTPGNGTLTTTDMYLHMWIAVETVGQSVFAIPNSINTLNNYPYSIDVESQKLNLVRDPQFTAGVSTSVASASVANYWRAYTSTGTASAGISDRVLTLTPSTAASVTLTTNITNDGTNYNRTPVLRGINYYFSIDDINNNVYKVTLQNDDGTIVIAQATTLYRSDDLAQGFRKYWQLTVPNSEPWYPLNSYKYSIHIWATATTSIPMIVTKPLFEPYAPGEYFDGNNENGGWLGGSDGGVGAVNSNADYRWGNATAHTNFSYYTADYNRAVNNVQQVIDNIVPATEYTTALASLRFNRIPGYIAAGQP